MRFPECQHCVKYGVCGTGDESQELFCEKFKDGYKTAYDEDGEIGLEGNPVFPKVNNFNQLGMIICKT